jgi:hypothetical protein
MVPDAKYLHTLKTSLRIQEMDERKSIYFHNAQSIHHFPAVLVGSYFCTLCRARNYVLLYRSESDLLCDLLNSVTRFH